MRNIKTDILVVGAGPSGLTATIALAMHGIPSITISKFPGTAHTPRAHITNARTMEVFRDLGIENEIREIGYPLSELNHNVMATSLSGMEIARYRSYGTPPDRLSDYAAASPCGGINAPQHVMEPVLLTAARKRGADVRFSNELTHIEQVGDEVRARVIDQLTGIEYEVQARYAIGADGGRSIVAEQLGFTFEGQAGLNGMANSWLEVDLSQYTAHRPGTIYWIGQPGHEAWFGTASWVNVKPWNEWAFLHPWNAAAGTPTPEDVIERARLTIGDPEAKINVKAITTWQVNNIVANEYRKGRVFLAGDAAHRHPPSGGLGTNTSVQDAYNLAWKLAYVLGGKAGEGLLESYNAERQPVGRQVVARAIESWRNMGKLIEALGFRQDQSKEEGWAALKELYADSDRAIERRNELAAAVKLQDYRSNALGVELGQRYASDAVADDGLPYPEPTRDPELYYQPTTHPGAHIPHAWVQHEQRQISTIDIVGHGKFRLIVGIGGNAWASAAASAGAELGIDLPVHAIGLRCAYDDVVGDWAAVREIGDRGALLVRPDRHVAWRSIDMAAKPEDTLKRALRRVLALEADRGTSGRRP